MSDKEESVELEPPQINFEELDPNEDVKVLVEGRDEEPEVEEEGEFKGLTRDQVIEKISAERKRNEEASKKPDIASEIKQSILGLAESLRPAPAAAADGSL